MLGFDSNTDYPALFKASDKASRTAQYWFVSCIWASALTMFMGTLLAAEKFAPPDDAYLSALFFLGGIFVSILMAFRKYEDVWYRARAIAESVKTSAWRFMMRAGPYDATKLSAAEDVLKEKFHELLSEHKEVSHEIGGLEASGDQITKRMYEAREQTLSERKDFYLLHRIQEQQNWYAKKSGKLLWRGRLWFGVMIALQLGALVLVLGKVRYPEAADWPAEAFAVAAGSALTWIQVRRFRELAAAYALTAHEIGLIKIQAKEADSEAVFSKFVQESESAFSREHTQWSARLDSVQPRPAKDHRK